MTTIPVLHNYIGGRWVPSDSSSYGATKTLHARATMRKQTTYSYRTKFDIGPK